MEENENINILEPIGNSDNAALLPIETLIHVIRNQQVMLDSDLARLYGVETRILNQAVKRNIERFPKDFMFQLTEEDSQNLKSQNVISSWGGNRKPLGKKIVAFSKMHQNPDDILSKLR